MRKSIILISAAVLAALCIGVISAAVDTAASRTEIVKDGESLYSVTYSKFWIHNNINDNYLQVELLADSLSKLTGADVEIYEAEGKIADTEIYVGNTAYYTEKHKERASLGGVYTVDEDFIGRGDSS